MEELQEQTQTALTPRSSRARRRAETSEKVLVITSWGGSTHHLELPNRGAAVAFAEWLIGETPSIRHIDLMRSGSGVATYRWANPVPPGQRAPWEAPPHRAEPMILMRHDDRRAYERAQHPPNGPGAVLLSEGLLVDPHGREYALTPCHMSSDGMTDCEIRPDGRRSLVRLSGMSYLVNHIPDLRPA